MISNGELQGQIDALAHLIALSDDRQKERIAAIHETIRVALDGANRAVEKAEDANNKRFDSVNNFREQLADQAAHFITSTEYRTAHSALAEKLDAVTAQMIAVDSTVRNKLPQVISGPAFFIGAGSVIVVVVLAVIGGAIQIGALQTRVLVNTDLIAHFVATERQGLEADTKQQVESATIKAQAKQNEARLGRIEAHIEKLSEAKQ